MGSVDLNIMIINTNPKSDKEVFDVLKQPHPMESLPAYHLETYPQTQQALFVAKESFANNKQYALVFIDLSALTREEGLETIKQLWEIDPQIQVVISMIYCSKEWDQTMKTLGLRDNYIILKKPLDQVAISQVTHALLKKWLLNKESLDYSELLKRTVEERTTSLEHSISLLRSTIESSIDGILVTDLNKKIIYFNKKLLQMWSIPTSLIEFGQEQLVLEHMRSKINFLNDDKACNTFLNTDAYTCSKQVITIENGDIIECCTQPHKMNDTVIGQIRSFHDITEQAQLEKKLSFQASHDTLTGLPNRILVFDRVITAIDRSARNKNEFALLFIDLDRFKLVNDSLSHALGDEFLKIVANRLSRLVRKEDTLARLGGDEFVMIIPELKKNEYAITIAAKILRAFHEPFFLANHKIEMTTSIGISIYPYDGDNVDDLLRNADLAMYKAKQQGGNQFQFYTTQLNEEKHKRAELEEELSQALTNKEFCLLYQPQLDLHSKSLTFIEALLRWNHPSKGCLTPIHFMREIEESGLIIPIGEWVIEKVCSQINEWKNKNLPPITVAINLSIQQLKQTNFAKRVETLLKKHNIDGYSLEFEIKESMLTNHPDVIARLKQIQAMGIRLVLDDFGIGNLNFRQLQSLKIHRLKIDPSYINNISFSHTEETIIKSIIAISQSLNVTVLAEGVENQNQMDFLKSQNCDQIQGFFFSKPLSAKTIEQFLKEIKKNNEE